MKRFLSGSGDEFQAFVQAHRTDLKESICKSCQTELTVMRRKDPSSNQVRPLLESLEDRLVLAANILRPAALAAPIARSNSAASSDLNSVLAPPVGAAAAGRLGGSLTANAPLQTAQPASAQAALGTGKGNFLGSTPPRPPGGITVNPPAPLGKGGFLGSTPPTIPSPPSPTSPLPPAAGAVAPRPVGKGNFLGSTPPIPPGGITVIPPAPLGKARFLGSSR